MNAFAQLADLNKSANMFSTGNGLADFGVDVAASSNPFTGVPYHGANMINNLSQGNYGSALADLGWGALSFLPGAGSAAKVGLKGLSAGAKALRAGSKATKAAPSFVNRATRVNKALPPAMPGVTRVAPGKESLFTRATSPQWLRPYQTGGEIAGATKKNLAIGGLAAGVGGTMLDVFGPGSGYRPGGWRPKLGRQQQSPQQYQGQQYPRQQQSPQQNPYSLNRNLQNQFEQYGN